MPTRARRRRAWSRPSTTSRSPCRAATRATRCCSRDREDVMTTTTTTTTRTVTTTAAAWLLAIACAGCNAPPGSMAAFDLDADWTHSDHYFDFPSPSTLRLKSDGTP